MTDIYRGLLAKIADEPERVLHERVSLSLFSKLRIGWRAFSHSVSSKHRQMTDNPDTPYQCWPYYGDLTHSWACKLPRGIIIAVGVSMAAGCGHGPRSVSDPDPGDKIPAIETAVRLHDMRAVPQLVTDLGQRRQPAIRPLCF